MKSNVNVFIQMYFFNKGINDQINKNQTNNVYKLISKKKGSHLTCESTILCLQYGEWGVF